MTGAPYLPCPVCHGPVIDSLTVRYLYPRPEPIMEAADPWNVHGTAHLRTCGSLACQAGGLLAVIDDIITDSAITLGHMLESDDIRIIHIGLPGDCTGIAVMDGGDAE
jgi:hypothetical protein